MSAAQSKEIMNDLMAELDGEDDDGIQEAYQMGQKLNTEEIAFNKEEEMNMKYDIKTNVDVSIRKRTIDMMATPKANPFAKDSKARAQPIVVDSHSSNDIVEIRKPANVEEIERVSQVEPEQPKVQESAVEQEWKAIKLQNE